MRTKGSHLPARSISPLGDRSCAQVERYMDANLGGVIRLHDLAKAACTSRFHFARRFRARTGMSPMEYVTGKRIDMAKAALLCPGRKICVIAQELGFHDQSHFSRTFSRWVGMSPREFRHLASLLPTRGDHDGISIP